MIRAALFLHTLPKLKPSIELAVIDNWSGPPMIRPLGILKLE
jgi:hypothetical protein